MDVNGTTGLFVNSDLFEAQKLFPRAAANVSPLKTVQCMRLILISLVGSFTTGQALKCYCVELRLAKFMILPHLH